MHKRGPKRVPLCADRDLWEKKQSTGIKHCGQKIFVVLSLHNETKWNGSTQLMFLNSSVIECTNNGGTLNV